MQGTKTEKGRGPLPGAAPYATFMMMLDRSVCYVRQQRNDPGTLNSCGQLSLVLRASAGDSSRQDLASLGHVLLQLLDILVIDRFRFICAELAHLFSSHACASSFHYPILLSLEWNVFVDRLEGIRHLRSRLIRLRRLVIATLASVALVTLVATTLVAALISVVPAALAAAVIVITTLALLTIAPVDELDSVRYDVCSINGLAILILIASRLDSALDGDFSSLGQVLLTGLRLLSEYRDPRKICLSLTAGSRRSVDRDRKGCDRHLAPGRIPDFRISGKPSDLLKYLCQNQVL